jgi:release factor H-coupled RctB family protein
MNEKKIKVFASKDNWIEGDALQQLNHSANLPGVVAAAGMPDLHPGQGCPVGAVFLSEAIIYPHFVGNDVGCGMGLWKTDLKKNKFKRDKYVKKLSGLENAQDGDITEWLHQYELEPSIYDLRMGSIGGGNHFAELQSFDKIYDQKVFDELQLDKKMMMILVHSGSRKMGEMLLKNHSEKCGAKGLQTNSDNGAVYLEQHNNAMRWAVANRALIADKMSKQLNFHSENVLDICHNSVTEVEVDSKRLWLHRKGAAPANHGPVIVPGTRGTLSYLVLPNTDQEQNLWSIAHGAGRKWNRSSVKGRLQARYRAESFIQTDIGSYVICEDKNLLFEEAPQAYKNIDVVVQDMVEMGLVSIIATLKPAITYKTRKRG